MVSVGACASAHVPPTRVVLHTGDGHRRACVRIIAHGPVDRVLKAAADHDPYEGRQRDGARDDGQGVQHASLVIIPVRCVLETQPVGQPYPSEERESNGYAQRRGQCPRLRNPRYPGTSDRTDGEYEDAARSGLLLTSGDGRPVLFHELSVGLLFRHLQQQQKLRRRQ